MTGRPRGALRPASARRNGLHRLRRSRHRRRAVGDRLVGAIGETVSFAQACRAYVVSCGGAKARGGLHGSTSIQTLSTHPYPVKVGTPRSSIEARGAGIATSRKRRVGADTKVVVGTTLVLPSNARLALRAQHECALFVTAQVRFALLVKARHFAKHRRAVGTDDHGRSPHPKVGEIVLPAISDRERPIVGSFLYPRDQARG